MRYKLVIEYNGSQFSGWQYQKHTHHSIQELIENAIFNFTQQKTRIFVGGRTDAGVHALGQVAHFDLLITKNIEPYTIRNAINYHLRPNPIAILSAELVTDDFHARFSAKNRYYTYKIINRYSPLTLEYNRAWHVCTKLSLENMLKASKHIIGNHDFSSFRSRGCQSSTPIKTINNIEIIKSNSEYIDINISAKSFLYKQVRIIVGTLVECGKNNIMPEDMLEILKKRNRAIAGVTAPAYGLYLMKIEY